jgi:hypothetical protein
MEVLMPFGTLWLPVLASAVVVFLASSVLHMVLRYHRADYKALPSEDAVGEVLRKTTLSPGLYMMPYCADAKSMNDPAVIERFTKGPVAVIAVLRSGPPNLGRHLALWFGFCALVSFVSGYIARHTLQPGAEAMNVMRITGTVAFVAYGMSSLTSYIWKGEPLANTMRGILDAVVYSILTGLVFRMLWPS